MNTLIYGQIGSGKTYLAIEKFILPALKEGRFVYTNIDFGHKFEFDVWSRFSNHLGVDISKFFNIVVETSQFLEKLKLIAYDIHGCKLPPKSVVVIDEAHQIFNYLDTLKIPRQVWEFLAYSRHFGIDLVFISQSPELLSKFIINLCNNFLYVYSLKQNSSLLKGRYKLEIRATYNGQILETKFPRYNQDIFKLYRSFVVDSDDSVFKRSALMQGWTKPAFAIILVLFLLGYAITHIKQNYFFSAIETKAQTQKTITENLQPQP
ncbi:MAG: zonular occludens toxin domain-containing protein [Sulfurihydrogenibium sp.]|nr:zonular occludens toxin domain-containing protein [Sulfurihydrogenibium sp.]